MASISGAWSAFALITGALLSTGCGESFFAGAGGSGGATSSGGTAGSGASTSNGGTAGSGGTTTPADCTEGAKRSCYSGPAGTDGVGVCKHGQQTCAQGMWGACKGEVVPAAMEICEGAKDDDCDGTVDNGCSCSVGATRDCYDGASGTENVGLCHGGTQTCKATATWGPCGSEVIPVTEICDGHDNDCNGATDDVENIGATCDAGGQGACKNGKQACDGTSLVCVGPAPTGEECNNVDDDCNGKVDDGIPSGGACQTPGCSGSILCSGGAMKCVLESTGNPELCGDGMDNDCNGVVDPIPQVYWGDTFSNGADKWMAPDAEWAFGNATASLALDPQFFGDPGTDHTPNSGDNKIAGVVLGGNASTVPHPPRYLTSKPIDLTQFAGSVVLSYWRWLNSPASPAMISSVQVFNGGAWLTLWQNVDASGNGFAVADGQWTPQVFDVTQYKDQQFQIRFGVAVNVDPDGQLPIPVGSWNIDDVALGNCY